MNSKSPVYVTENRWCSTYIDAVIPKINHEKVRYISGNMLIRDKKYARAFKAGESSLEMDLGDSVTYKKKRENRYNSCGI